ncbi:MAG: serine/threonine protein kinase [Myxococcota bacterium]|nr:serine/threonine protein kinase [Myxococcota bacterium]
MSDEDETKPATRRRERQKVAATERVAAVAADELIGQTVLDRYIIESELGAGAMGAVYKGRHIKLKRPVAIKVLHDEFVNEPTMLARFRREAQIAAKLSHVNVIGVLDVGQTKSGRQVMVMEFAEGPTLTEVMTIAPARRRVIQLVRQLLQGLAHAHGEGLIHRDLKPDNIIVEISQDGTEIPRIVDFGIAILRAPNGEFGERLTASGMMLGTPLYMSPEQAQCDPIDHRADLFSLGVIVYEMLAGKPPFEGTSMEIAVANISRDPPPIAKRAPNREVDPALELYARRLMARRADHRFATAKEALAMLDLIEHKPKEALLALGQMDVEKALAVISLPKY